MKTFLFFKKEKTLLRAYQHQPQFIINENSNRQQYLYLYHSSSFIGSNKFKV